MGNVVSIDVELELELVNGTNSKRVPMLNDDLSNTSNVIKKLSRIVYIY